MLIVEGTGYNFKLNDYGLHPKSKSKWGGTFFRSLHINMKKNRYYKREDNNLNVSGLVNTVIDRKMFGTRAEENHTATVCVVFIQCRQEEHCSALTQIYKVVTYYVESVKTISLYC
jgi:hypothetical protein